MRRILQDESFNKSLLKKMLLAGLHGSGQTPRQQAFLGLVVRRPGTSGRNREKDADIRRHLSRMQRRLSPPSAILSTGHHRRIPLSMLRPRPGSFRRIGLRGVSPHGATGKDFPCSEHTCDGLRIAAAGSERCSDLADVIDREAAAAWGNDRPCADDRCGAAAMERIRCVLSWLSAFCSLCVRLPTRQGCITPNRGMSSFARATLFPGAPPFGGGRLGRGPTGPTRHPGRTPTTIPRAMTIHPSSAADSSQGVIGAAARMRLASACADAAWLRQQATSQNKPGHRSLRGWWCNSLRRRHQRHRRRPNHHPPSQTPLYWPAPAPSPIRLSRVALAFPLIVSGRMKNGPAQPAVPLPIFTIATGRRPHCQPAMPIDWSARPASSIPATIDGPDRARCWRATSCR
jgi:hypothetical protein